jgi:hypothetical protein
LFSRISHFANGTKIYETFPFGDYVTSALLCLSFDKTVENAVALIYNYTSSEALTLDIEPSLIVNTVTIKIALELGHRYYTSNKLTYRLFTGPR